MKSRLKNIVMIASLLCASSAFAVEPPTTLISFCPGVLPDATIEYTEEGVEDMNFSPPSESLLRELDGELELLVFTVKESGVCSACDRARPQWKGLVDEYPITPVYCSMSTKPRVRGDVVAREYEVDAFPTFVLVVRNDDGSADEVSRWKGAGSFWESTAKRIKREFAEADYKPRIERDGIKPPPRKPRPIPGLRPPKPRDDPKPSPKPRPEPGNKPGRPRVSFDIEL